MLTSQLHHRWSASPPASAARSRRLRRLPGTSGSARAAAPMPAASQAIAFSRGLLRRARPHAGGSACCPAPAAPSDPDAVVISHALWQQRFGGAADVIGRPLRLGSGRTPSSPSAPRGFAGIDDDPGGRLGAARGRARRDRGLADGQGSYFGLRALVRLQARRRSRARRGARQPGLQRRHKAHRSAGRHRPGCPPRVRRRCRPDRRPSSSTQTQVLLAVAAVSALVLLMACGNVAQPARSSPGCAGRPELALKAALGADARSPAARSVPAGGPALAARPAPARSAMVLTRRRGSCDGCSCRRSPRRPRPSTRASCSSPSAICARRRAAARPACRPFA